MNQTRTHIIGIAGIGMSATGLLLKERGHVVTGSDEGIYPPASVILPAAGIAVMSPHAATNIPADVDQFVIGKHAKLTAENPEVAAAMATGKPILSYPEVLAQLTRGRRNLVVAGSYGKSTSTALIAWALAANGREPGYFIGALPKNLATHAALGRHEAFVIEGDEYPSSNTDPSSKFMHYAPSALLLTAAMHDHVNVFPTQEDYLRPFRALLRKMPSGGLVVACLDEPFAAGLAREGHPGRTVFYSLENPAADYHARTISYGETTTFTLVHRGTALGAFSTTQLGAHNLQNMVGAAAMLIEEKLLSPQEIGDAFARFAGVMRRMDKLTAKSPIPAYEGFGSSREKALSAIDAIRLHFPRKRLVIVFEPHTFSWRSRDALHWYDTVFREAAEVFVYRPPHHGATAHNQASHAEITARIAATGLPTHALSGDEGAIVAALKPDDVVLILSSGDMDGMIARLVRRMEG
ncbi:MAG TPA: Mur ligase family protein [Beijerinckiaceae bacterium]|nr:Mur ligase family protein [Beijerinckiaceae bacterium]